MAVTHLEPESFSDSERKNQRKIVREFSLIDADTGDILMSHQWTGSQNGDDWMIFYRITAALIASGKLSLSAIRVFNFFLAWSTWESVWVGTKTEIAEKLGIARKTVHSALDELKAWDLIREGRRNGCSAFFINPDNVTKGRDKQNRAKIYAAIGGETAAEALKEENLETPF